MADPPTFLTLRRIVVTLLALFLLAGLLAVFGRRPVTSTAATPAGIAVRAELPYLPWRFRQLRPILEGEPVILIQDGNVIEKNLSRNRLTQEEIAAEARSRQIDSLDQIRLGGARDERKDQLHREELLVDLRATCRCT